MSHDGGLRTYNNPKRLLPPNYGICTLQDCTQSLPLWWVFYTFSFFFFVFLSLKSHHWIKLQPRAINVINLSTSFIPLVALHLVLVVQNLSTFLNSRFFISGAPILTPTFFIMHPCEDKSLNGISPTWVSHVWWQIPVQVLPWYEIMNPCGALIDAMRPNSHIFIIREPWFLRLVWSCINQ